MQLLPSKARFGPDEPIVVEVRGLARPGVLQVLHLGEPVTEVPVAADGPVEVGRLPVGGYGVRLGDARTAVEVAGARPAHLRYGFVADYRPDRSVAGFADNLRRLHLTDVQFYDWAYRHADVLGGGERYRDALDQPIALDTVRRLVRATQEHGARALGYAAVYASGPAEWPAWRHAALITPSGSPYVLGDFLYLLDPADLGWQRHFTADLRAALTSVGFDGFHLDQYGYPKIASRPDGTHVQVAESFASLIDAVRAALPDARLIFNNVNDFPTWRTAATPQDALYVEVWPPHTRLEHLAEIAERTRRLAAGRPVVVAAYQHVYTDAEPAAADLAAAYTMATLFSHGATQLLCGEADRILVDPYYVRNHRIAPSTAALLHRWYDFLVEHHELLFGPQWHDVTGAVAGDYNDDCDVRYEQVDIDEYPRPGTVWRRVRGDGERAVLHLLNLVDQVDTDWDTPRRPVTSEPRATLRVRRAGRGDPRVRVADPDRHPHLVDVPVRIVGDFVEARLPALHVWQLVLIDHPVARTDDAGQANRS